MCSSYMFIRHKIKRQKGKTTATSCSHGWLWEVVLRGNIKGCTRVGGFGEGRRAQLEDLLIALADRRSFPDTRFFVARGMVGETWSTESAAPAGALASVLVLPVKEPGRQMQAEIVDRNKQYKINQIKSKIDNGGERETELVRHWQDFIFA